MPFTPEELGYVRTIARFFRAFGYRYSPLERCAGKLVRSGFYTVDSLLYLKDDLLNLEADDFDDIYEKYTDIS